MIKEVWLAQLAKLSSKIDRIRRKPILKTRSRKQGELIFLLRRILLIKFPDLRISQINEVAGFYSDCILCIDASEENQQRIESLVGDIHSLRDELLADMKIKKSASEFFLLTAYYYDHSKSPLLMHEVDRNLEIAKRHQPSAELLNLKSYSDLKRASKSTYRKIRKNDSEEVKNKLDRIIDNTAPKLELTSSSIGFLLSVSATIFLIAGYVYSRYLLSHFGIEASDFYSASDYISSSVNKLQYAALLSLIHI